MNPQFEELVNFRSGDTFPDWAKDGVTTRTTLHFNWADRLRILFGFAVELDCFTATENTVGRTESKSCLRVFNPRRLMRMSGDSTGYAEVNRTPERTLCPCVKPFNDAEAQPIPTGRRLILVTGYTAEESCHNCNGSGIPKPEAHATFSGGDNEPPGHMLRQAQPYIRED